MASVRQIFGDIRAAVAAWIVNDSAVVYIRQKVAQAHSDFMSLPKDVRAKKIARFRMVVWTLAASAVAIPFSDPSVYNFLVGGVAIYIAYKTDESIDSLE